MLFISTSLFAGETVISSRTVELSVNLNEARVYTEGTSFPVRLLYLPIPELTKVTLLNHRYPEEAAPVLINGTAELEDIRQGNPDTITLPVVITLTKYMRINRKLNVCKVELTEDLEATLNNLKFQHSSTTVLPDRHVSDCK